MNNINNQENILLLRIGDLVNVPQEFINGADFLSNLNQNFPLNRIKINIDGQIINVRECTNGHYHYLIYIPLTKTLEYYKAKHIEKLSSPHLTIYQKETEENDYI